MRAVIAERKLELDGDSKGFVRLYAPKRDRKNNGWTCEFHLVWPGFEQRQKAGGVDSYQAVKEALRGAPLFISRTSDYQSGRLRCMGVPLSASPLRQPEYTTNLQSLFDVRWIPGDQP